MDFAPEERSDLPMIIAWLRERPEEYALIRTAARLDYAPETIWPDPDVYTGSVRRREVERYFASGVLGWCSGCLLPCVTFADGIRIEWPSVQRHECKAQPPRYKAVAI